MSGLSGFQGADGPVSPLCRMARTPLALTQQCPHDLVDDLLAAGLRPRLETHGALGSRIHTSRQRRDCLIAVLGQAEIDAHQVHVTDIAAGSTSPVARDRLIQTLQHSHRKRTATPNWARPD